MKNKALQDLRKYVTIYPGAQMSIYIRTWRGCRTSVYVHIDDDDYDDELCSELEVTFIIRLLGVILLTEIDVGFHW
jgi:hypothetical protein